MTQNGTAVLINPQLQNSYSYAGNNPIVYKDPNGELAVLALMGLGGLANMALQGVEDYAQGNDPQWQDYAGSFAGGVAAVGTAMITKNVFIAGATGASVEESYSQMLKGDKDLYEVAGQGGLGGAFSVGSKYIKITGLNKGRNNINAVADTITTKSYNGTINNFSAKTASKVSISNLSNGAAQTAYNSSKSSPSKSSFNSASKNLEKANKALKAGDYSGSIKYLQAASNSLKK